MAAAASPPAAVDSRHGSNRDFHSRDNFAVVAARNVSIDGTVTRSSQVLPTPPNSISPALGPHSLKRQLAIDNADADIVTDANADASKPDPLDSFDSPDSPASNLDLDMDLVLDLQDATDSSTTDTFAYNGADGTITSSALANHHLPDILLRRGPVVIRHIMGYLSKTVPGFAAIPPTEARRIVLAALEGKVGGKEEDDSYVVFEKVGWGRWDARRHGHASRQKLSSTPPPDRRAEYACSRALHIPDGTMSLTSKSCRPHRPRQSPASSVILSYENYGNPFKVESETDMMSLDGSASRTCSDDEHGVYADCNDYSGHYDDNGMHADMDMSMEADSDDATDDEDWAAMGAAALREESYPGSAALPVTDGWGISRVPTSARFGSHSVPASVPAARPFGRTLDSSNLGAPENAQERAAIEALLSLGAV